MFRYRARSLTSQPLATTLPITGAPALPAVDTRRPWGNALRASIALVVARPSLIAVGLAGFLARGGLLLFILPFVAVPTVVGLGNFIGPTQITASGPTTRLLWLIAALVGAAVLAIAVGTLIGALADVGLYRAATGAEGADGPERAEGSGRRRHGGLVARVVLIRLLAMAPLGLALAWSANRFGTTAYRELILPQELVTPMVVRVLDQTRDAVAVVIAAWLGGELIGGLAVRQHLRRGGAVPWAFVRAVGDLVRRPLTTLGGFGLGLVALIVTVTPIVGFAWLLFGGVRFAIGRDEITRIFAASVLFVAASGLALVVAGTISALRGLVATYDALRVVPAGGDLRPPEG